MKSHNFTQTSSAESSGAKFHGWCSLSVVVALGCAVSAAEVFESSIMPCVVFCEGVPLSKAEVDVEELEEEEVVTEGECEGAKGCVLELKCAEDLVCIEARTLLELSLISEGRLAEHGPQHLQGNKTGLPIETIVFLLPMLKCCLKAHA